MTKGNKNVLNSSSENLHKFWDLNKNKKYKEAYKANNEQLMEEISKLSI